MSEPGGTQSILAPVSAPCITTVAGQGNGEYTGDGHAATEAGLYHPNTVATDAFGNLYIADSENHRVRRVDARTQTISTVAGNGNQEFSGDDGPAVDASLSGPRGIAVDAEGNLYIADTDHHRVRRVDAKTQTISTVAGDGRAGFDGDDKAADEASLYTPFGVVVDSGGHLYIADTDNHRVRKVDAKTQTITTVAGNGDEDFSGDDGPAVHAALNHPRAVVVDTGGNLYIADTDNDRVRRVDAKTRTITTVVGDGSAIFSGDHGPAVNAGLNRPRGVVVDSEGSLYVADTHNHRVRRVDGKTQTIITFAGDGSADYGGDGGPADKAALNGPCGAAVGSDGSLYISDTQNNRVRKVSGVPVPALFSVWPGGLTTLERGTGKAGWPGVYVKALGGGTVLPQTVRVTLPPGRHLQFSGSGSLMVFGKKKDGGFGPLATYSGSLSDDKQTFTTHGPVDLLLSKEGTTNSLLVEVQAPADAVLGEARLTFTVGDHAPTSAPVDVTVGFSVSPGGPTKVKRGQDQAWPGIYVKALGDGVPPQRVSVRLPGGKGLRFYGSGNLLVWGNGQQLASYGGILSDDKQTFTTGGPVDLHLSGAGTSNSLLIGVQIPADAELGEAKPAFTVGDKSTYAPVEVVAE
ncbi:hypothetical protein GCM10010507_00190 [Streptomyces cinnamoneus]|uniref:Teneurin NHL domain-containing protein n=2 Tax=Streptomyces cinnamoneus TaxID=53446 RepID=A0A918TAA6_STRCJ|nr:hypothetical protein GCM10010507_00190 [Streptomyces cinnamoneus]